MESQHTLVVTDGPNVGKAYPLQGMVCTLGRSADNTVVFDSARVSRHHVQIRLLATGAVAEDLGSTNGTWVNGRRLVEPVTLSPGDEIRVADYITLEYAVSDPGAAATLVGDIAGGSTQVMGGDAFAYEPPTPPPPPGDVFAAYDPAPAPRPEVAPSQPVVAYSPPVGVAQDAGLPFDEVPAADIPSPRRPRWLGWVIGILIVLILLCVALAIYLWFAPITFWERVFEMFGIPMPSAELVSLSVPGALRL